MRGILLDTCALIWTLEGADMTASSKLSITQEAREGKLFVNPMSAWEVGMLVSKNRLNLTMSVEKWFDQITTSPFFTLAKLTPSVLIQSTILPSKPPSDPADKIMIAMARENQWSLMTRDKQILNYGQMGHVQTVEC